MLWIDCPWCGARPESEFRYGGEAHIARPDPAATDDAGWADYLFMRTNPKGVHAERWMHREGCRGAAGGGSTRCATPSATT